MFTATTTVRQMRSLNGKNSSIVSGVRIENEHGFWATLRFDPQGGRHGYGVYYVEAWAPYFPDHITKTTLTSDQHRDVCERQLRAWLKNAS